MTESRKPKVSPNLSLDTKLWRYMSLDKFIDYLATGELYFTPISAYKNTDPFEGLLPRVAIEGVAEAFDSAHRELSNVANFMQKHLEEFKDETSASYQEKFKAYEELTEQNSQLKVKAEKAYFKLMQSMTVNCWHRNEYESEGMWRLYSDTNKGLAIQTTLRHLLESISTERYLEVSEVKYIDFMDPSLTAPDCVVNGSLGPFLKRNSFSHENEVRLTTLPKIDNDKIEDYEPTGIRITSDPIKLIVKVYISPYSSQPYPSAVNAIAEKFGLDKSVILKSQLLEVDETLTRLF